jgi:hypothetical protein
MSWGSQYNEVEADREEHRRRQEFLELFDDECEEARLGLRQIPMQVCCKGNGRDFTHLRLCRCDFIGLFVREKMAKGYRIRRARFFVSKGNLR